MPFEPGQRVVAAIETAGPLTGRILRDTTDTTPGAPTPPAGSPRVYAVEWTLPDGSVVSNTAAESALRAADDEPVRG